MNARQMLRLVLAQVCVHGAMTGKPAGGAVAGVGPWLAQPAKGTAVRRTPRAVHTLAIVPKLGL